MKAARADIKSHGYKFQSILGFGNNPKTLKSDAASDYLTAIAYLQPNYSTCAYSKMAKCDVACLNTAGRGGMNNVQRVRHDRTKCYYEHPALFMPLLHIEIVQHIKRCDEGWQDAPPLDSTARPILTGLSSPSVTLKCSSMITPKTLAVSASGTSHLTTMSPCHGLVQVKYTRRDALS